MLQSAEVDQIAPAWVAALTELVTIPKTKTAKIPTKTGGSYSYKYADLGTVIFATKPVLGKHGIVVHQYSVDAEPGKVRCVTRAWHTSGQWFEDGGMSMPAPNDPQQVGGAVTYLRRYSLVAFLGLATEEDDDGHGAKQAIVEDAAEQREQAEREQRALTAFHDLKNLDDAGKERFKKWAGDRRGSVPAMVQDPVWLEHVESWIDEDRHSQAELYGMPGNGDGS